MKKVLFSIAILGTLFAACSKSSTTTNPTNTNPTPTIPTDGWKLDGTKHTQVVVVRQESQGLVNATDGTSGSINTFGAFFKTYPSASGSFKIAGFVPDASAPYPNQKLAADEIVLIATVPNTSTGNKSYWTTGVENKKATVTVTGGKIKVEVPEVAVTGGNNDTLKLTGTITEK